MSFCRVFVQVCALFAIFGVLTLKLYNDLFYSDTPKSDFRYKRPKRIESDLMSTKNRNEIKKFHYFALAKTGSTVTREHLKAYCSRNKMVCLSFCQCGKCMSFAGCVEKLTDSKGFEPQFTYGFMTVWRLEHCCQNLNKIKEEITAVVDHFPLNSDENRRFLEDFLPKDMFRFTILRDPVRQFLSYHNMLSHGLQARHTKIPKLEEMVDIFYGSTIADKTPTNADHKILFEMTTNSQAKFLGWNQTKGDIKNVMNFLSAFQFVGLTENMSTTWSVLRSKLGWPKNYFDTRKTKNESSTFAVGKVEKLDPEIVRKIQVIQHADIKLYGLAKQLFRKFVHQETVIVRDGLRQFVKL